MIDRIKKQLNELAEEKTKLFSQRIIPTVLPILGVKTPDLRKLAKIIVKEDYRLFLAECDQSSYELMLLEGIVIGIAPCSIQERFELLDKFLPKIENWAVHDGLVTSLKSAKKYPEEFLEYLSKYQNSKKEYEVRFVAVMLMCYFLNDDYIHRAFNMIEHLNIETFYAKMGVAWFLATAIVSYSSLVYSYLDQVTDEEVVRMTIRKVRDSYRVSAEDKEKILQYKHLF